MARHEKLDLSYLDARELRARKNYRRRRVSLGSFFNGDRRLRNGRVTSESVVSSQILDREKRMVLERMIDRYCGYGRNLSGFSDDALISMGRRLLPRHILQSGLGKMVLSEVKFDRGIVRQAFKLQVLREQHFVTRVRPLDYYRSPSTDATRVLNDVRRELPAKFGANRDITPVGAIRPTCNGGVSTVLPLDQKVTRAQVFSPKTSRF